LEKKIGHDQYKSAKISGKIIKILSKANSPHSS
jgi:hypothetical protein